MRQDTLVAALEGGSRMVGDGARLVVSAAPSYDPDDADTAAASLWFAWGCARDDTGGACPSVAESLSSSLASADDDGAAPYYWDGGARFERGRANVTVNASTLASAWEDGGVKYVFSVVVAKPGRNASAAASLSIEVVHGDVPRVSIGALGAAKYNPNDGDYLALEVGRCVT